jgi:hypothetical protein
VKRSGALPHWGVGIWGSTSKSDLGVCSNLPVCRLRPGRLGPASCDAKRRRVSGLLHWYWRMEIRRTGEGEKVTEKVRNS